MARFMSAVIDARLHRSGADSNRAFNYAVLASIVLHGALLFSFSLRQSKSPPAVPGPIVARLAQPSAQAPAAAPQPQPEPPKPRVEEPTPPPQVKPVPQQKPSPLAKAAPVPAKPSAKAAPEAPAQPSPAAPPTPTAPSSAPPAPASVPGPIAKAEPAPTAPAPSADAGTLETYRMDLMRMARNYKRYPRVAMDNNWEGRVVIRMIIGANGMISSIAVVTSSGHEILDKQALDMIQKAKPRVQIPAALRGREFPLDIPVVYSLKEPDSG